MIALSFLWKCVKSVFKLMSKILGFLIVKLYLWIPLLFAGIFALCSAIVPFSFLKYLPHFIVIEASGLVLSMLLFVRKIFGLKKPKESEGQAPEQQPPEKKETIYHYYQDGSPEEYVSPQDIKRSFSQRRNAEWFNAAYEVVPDIKPAPDIPDLKSYNNPNLYSNNYDASHEPPARLYRTRKDPSLFIAEYPDRLEYYRKTSNGLVLVSVEENNIRLQNNY
jgi:hypothetical protein